jgi:hypothetical protein
MKSIDRPTGSVELCTVSLTFEAKRGDELVRMWVDVEAIGQKAFELADIPPGMGVTITGELRRAAWKDRRSDEWRHRHYVMYLSHILHGDKPEEESGLPF